MIDLDIVERDGDVVYWTYHGQEGETNLTTGVSYLCEDFFLLPVGMDRKITDEVREWVEDEPNREMEFEEWEARYMYYHDLWCEWGDSEEGELIEHAIPAVYEDPNAVAASGTVRFIYKDDFSGTVYLSEEVTDPTWADVLMLFDKAIEVTGDYHYVFLEGITNTSAEGILTFLTGS